MERWRAKEVNNRIRERIAPLREQLEEQNVVPCLATLRVGNRSEDLSYLKSLERALSLLSICLRQESLPEDAGTEAVVEAMRQLSSDSSVDGILLMQPMPEGIDTLRVKEALAEEKDVDGTTLSQMGRILAGFPDGMAPGAPSAVIEMLDFHEVDLKGKNIVLIGSGVVVGRPLGMLLVARGATVTFVNTCSRRVSDMARKADILVSAAGVAGLVTDQYVHPGQVVIDVGMSWKEGRMCGDVDWDAVEPIARAATPTPGGIGNITSTLIAERVIKKAWTRRNPER